MKKIKGIFLLIGIITILLLISITVINNYNSKETTTLSSQTNNKLALEMKYNEKNEFMYLSDIKPISSSVGYKSVSYDVNTNGGNISLIVDGAKKYFIKGVAAHATSTLIYDLKDYNYDLFTAYLGMDASVIQNTSTDGAKFYIYGSNDNSNWTQLYESDKPYKAAMNAVYVSLDISSYQYLKLYCNQVGNNWNDYATYANAKLAKSTYVEKNEPVDCIKTIAEYDKIIQGYSLDTDVSNYELTLLQRTFVKNMNYDLLQALCQYDESYTNTVKWIMNDQEALKLFLTGGKPDGEYTKALKNLTNLYTKHGEDLKDTTIDSISNIQNGKVYQKMMIALSLSHTRDISFWMDSSQASNPVVRYEVFKDLRLKGKIENKIFDTVPIIDMRLIFNSMISDEQIAWLNYYSREKNSINPYSYIKYTDGYNYTKEQYYIAENYEKWDDKYHLSEYNIPYETGHPKLWIMFEEGSVCGGLSKTGTNLNTARGIPALVLGQPGHAAYMYLSLTPEGLGKWDLGNDVSGWTKSYWTYEGNVATGWGTEGWSGNYVASYTMLSQAALNDLNNYQKAEEYMYLANVYKDKNAKDYQTLERIYNLAIEKQSINFDAWKEIVNLYKEDTTKTESDILVLSKRVADSLTYYPLPMISLLNQLDPYIKTEQGIAEFTILKKDILDKAVKATAQDTLQPGVASSVAKYLLGENDLSIASFSFDGENAGKIMLSSRFNDSQARLKYSLDGEITWIETNEKVVTLTSEQLKQINSTDDIKVGLVGSSAIQIIDITQAAKPSNVYNNDREDKVIGATNDMEWSFDQITWTSYSESFPDLTGNVSVSVRIPNKGTAKASEAVSLNFTKEEINYNQAYVPIKHLSIDSASSYQGGQEPKNAIDGNIKTMWHVNWNGADNQKYITIKLDEPMYISALEYVPGQVNSNGIIKGGKVYLSMDGKEWKEAATFSNWASSYTAKTVKFNPQLASYVKLVATNTVTNYANASMINLFRDETLLPGLNFKSTEGTYDLYKKSELHKDLILEITKNAETISSIVVNGNSYNFANTEEMKELSEILDVKEVEGNYEITFLSSWLDILKKGDYTISFVSNKENTYPYNIHIVDTCITTKEFESEDKKASIKLENPIDNTYDLKVKQLNSSEENVSKFKEYLKNKDILGYYDISLYDGDVKVSYDNSLEITLNLGIEYANKNITILQDKNNQIGSYNIIVDTNGRITFTSLKGLSNILVIKDKENVEEPDVPEEVTITSSYYKILKDNYITGIIPNTTIETLMKNLTTNANEIEILDKDGKEVNGIIATGMTLKLNGQVSYKLIVKGDCNYDGVVDIVDLSILNKKILGIKQLSKEQLLAVDVNQDDVIDIVDLSIVNKVVLGIKSFSSK